MQKKLWKKAHDRMEEIYGEQPPIQMISRFESEKARLQDTDFIVFADFIGELAGMCNREYGDIFNRGELESSFIAWLLGATKCNPLPAHYYCPKCSQSGVCSNRGLLLGLAGEKMRMRRNHGSGWYRRYRPVDDIDDAEIRCYIIGRVIAGQFV